MNLLVIASAALLPVTLAAQAPAPPTQAGAPQVSASERFATPKDRDEMSRLLDEVTSISISRLTPKDAQVPYLRGAKIVMQNGWVATGDSSVSEDEAPAFAITVRTPEEVAAWVTACKESLSDDGQPGRGGRLSLRMQLRDGRCLRWLVFQADPPFFLCGPVRLFGGAKLRSLLERAASAADRQLRATIGVALDLAELRSFPSTLCTVRCQGMGAELLQAELSRFHDLQALAVQPTAGVDLPHGDIIAAIANLRTLQQLELPADALDQADIAVLAALPLRSLVLTGHLKALPPKCFAAFRHLEKLGLALNESDVDLRAVLASLPRLRELCLDDCSWFKPHDFEALQATKIERLSIRLSTTISGIANLADLPSLRELHLAAIGIGPEEQSSLAQLAQLRRLEVLGVLWTRPAGHEGEVTMAELARQLPECEVTGVGFSLLRKPVDRK